MRIDAEIKKQADVLFSKLAKYKHGNSRFYRAGSKKIEPYLLALR